MACNKRSTKMIQIVLLLIFTSTVVNCKKHHDVTVDESASMGEARLHHRLKRYYTPLVRPVRRSNMSTVVQVGVSALKISNMNEEDDEMELTVMLLQKWHDDIFMWDPDQYGGVSKIQITNHDIWKPEITSDNHFTHTNMNHKDIPLKVTWDGSVTWQYTTKVKASCRLRTHIYPFDRKHKCSLYLRSFVYDSSQVTLDFVNGQKTMELNHYQNNRQWRLSGGCGRRQKLKHFTMDNSDDDQQYDTLHYELHVQRRDTSHQLLALLLPVFFISLIIPTVFLLPDGRKITLSIGLTIAIILLVNNMDTHLPKPHVYLSVMEQYYLGVFVLSCLATLLVTLTTNMSEGSLPSQEPPAILKKMTRGVLSCIGWVSCLRHLSKINKSTSSPTCEVNGAAVGCGDEQPLNTATTSYSSLTSMDKHEASHDDAISFSSVPVTPSQLTQQHQRLAIRRLEWRIMATVINRCCFVIFTISIAILPIVLVTLVYAAA